MRTWTWYWQASTLVVGTGLAITVLTFNQAGHWPLVGLTLVILGAAVANLGCTARRARSLEVEYDAGYRAGYREGRKAPTLRLVDLEGWKEYRGGLSKTSVGAMASHGAPAGRSTQDAHGPTQGRGEVLGRGRGGGYSPWGMG